MPIKTNGEFYPRYKAAKLGFSADTFACAKQTVDALLTSATTSDKPGMLLGAVATGKKGNKQLGNLSWEKLIEILENR